jgi:hypothetical protein
VAVFAGLAGASTGSDEFEFGPDPDVCFEGRTAAGGTRFCRADFCTNATLVRIVSLSISIYEGVPTHQFPHHVVHKLLDDPGHAILMTGEDRRVFHGVVGWWVAKCMAGGVFGQKGRSDILDDVVTT